MEQSSQFRHFLASEQKAAYEKQRKRDRPESSPEESVNSNKKGRTLREEGRVGGEPDTKELAQGAEPSQKTAGGSFGKKTTGRSFPEKVLEIIENPKNKNVIWWNKAGTAICISPKNFHSQVMDKYFQGTKFDSFARRLIRHGFSRIPDDDVPPGTHVYYHDLFIRGQPELIEQMKGGEKYEPPAVKERKKARDPDADATSGLITLNSLYSSSDTGTKTRPNDATKNAMLSGERHVDIALGRLPATESASLHASNVALLNQQLNTAAKNEFNMINLNRLNAAIGTASPSATTALNTLRNETSNLSSIDPQVQQQLFSQLLYRQTNQQQLLQQQQNAHITNELTRRQLLLDFAGLRGPYRGSALLPPNALGLPNVDSLLASHLRRQQQAMSSITSRPDQRERASLDAQTLQLQILREKQRQNELSRLARGNL